jgi:GNAT superfamily N-acetyltransferase
MNPDTPNDTLQRPGPSRSGGKHGLSRAESLRLVRSTETAYARLVMTVVSMKTITPCDESDVPVIFDIINQSALAYKGVIPPDRWHEPYMPLPDLESEIARGVRFFGYRFDGRLAGVMGIQDVKDVTLIRHAYVRSEYRRQGIGRALLDALAQLTERPVLIGTWKAATWAVRFYEKNGFVLVSEEEKNRLLKIYWTIPERQIEESVVLADSKWRDRGQ